MKKDKEGEQKEFFDMDLESKISFMTHMKEKAESNWKKTGSVTVTLLLHCRET